LNALKTKTATLLELVGQETDTVLKHALHELHANDKIKLISYKEHHYITLTPYYSSEKGCASKVIALKNYRSKLFIDLDAAYASLRVQRSAHEIVLNDEQQTGIMTCLQNKVTIITGGPGTGKTTLIKKLLSILDDHNCRYRLAAPTGRAAKRITEGTGRHATTLHRLLEFDFLTRTFVHNEHNALDLDFLIVDESSMIDIFLAYATLKALPLHAHLLFIGDVDQLPSVGAGNFLNDLIASSYVTCIRLKQIFRQAQDSLIIVNAHRINNGEFPITDTSGTQRDFLFIQEDDPVKITEHLATIFTTILPRYRIHAQDAAVLVPMNRGAVGTFTLNHHLQQLFNPATTVDQIPHRGSMLKVGDRVMQIRNNYDKRVFNGDIGVIEEIKRDDQIMVVNYQDTSIEYEFSELDEIVLAYAITIHKSQGSEYAATIIPLFMQHFMLLQRNLIYTAVTRAKKLCIFIGQTKAVAMAIKNNKGLLRTTFLQQFLTTDLQCR
jgi:exodeoxyribonuclease V alpha subunit